MQFEEYAFLLLFIGLKAVLVTPHKSARVLGGEEANPKFVFHVASVRLDNTHICGGSIISPRAILTAAHCVFEHNQIVIPERLNVRLGSTNQFSAGHIIPIKSIVVHPEYCGYKNNLAILLIEEPLLWTDRIKSITLATEKVETFQNVRVSGWGAQPNESLYKLHTNTLYVANDDECRSAYPDHDNSTFCVQHDLKEGNCLGDAGNGAEHNYFLVGIANFAVGACGSSYFDVYTDTVAHADWILSVIG